MGVGAMAAKTIYIYTLCICTCIYIYIHDMYTFVCVFFHHNLFSPDKKDPGAGTATRTRRGTGARMGGAIASKGRQVSNSQLKKQVLQVEGWRINVPSKLTYPPSSKVAGKMSFLFTCWDIIFVAFPGGSFLLASPKNCGTSKLVILRTRIRAISSRRLLWWPSLCRFPRIETAEW